MPNWKKLIVSGSDATLNSLNVTQNVVADSFTGSLSYNDLVGTPEGLVSSSSQIELDQISGSTFANQTYTFPSNVIIEGQLTASSFTSIVSQSIIITDSGSTKFGDSLDDTHQFTGSLLVSGTIEAPSITGSLDGTASYAISASYAENAGLLDGLDSTVFATTGSNTFVGEQIVSGNITQTGSLTTNGLHVLLQDNTEFSISGSEFLFDFDTFDFSGSMEVTGSFDILGSITATSITSSLDGTASYAENANLLDGLDSTVFATTGSNQFNGDQTITGSLTLSSSLFQYGSNTDIDSGSVESVLSVPTESYNAAFFDYVIVNGTNSRAGTVTAVWNGSSVQYNEVYTSDIGDTNDVVLEAQLSGANIELQATTFSDNWEIRSLVRML